MMQDVVEYYSPSSCSAFSKAVILNLNLSSLAIDFNLYFILRPLPFKFGEINFRTNKRYKRHLKKAIEQLVYKGIKGATYLTKWILMPNEILLDYMHLCLIGFFKSIISNLFDSKYKNKDLGFGSFYLGKYFDYF